MLGGDVLGMESDEVGVEEENALAGDLGGPGGYAGPLVAGVDGDEGPVSAAEVGGLIGTTVGDGDDLAVVKRVSPTTRPRFRRNHPRGAVTRVIRRC